MKLNFKKTSLAVFNPCKSFDFRPNFELAGNELDVVEEFKLLGTVISTDLKWASNSRNLVVKAMKRLWMLRRLKNLGASSENLLDVYIKQIRCVLELAAPAWQGSITLVEKKDLERVQKCALAIILGKSYSSYDHALKILGLDTLDARRNKLSLKFALKAEKHPKFKNWFIPEFKKANTRSTCNKYKEVRSNHERYQRSPLSFLTSLLNDHYKNVKS